MLGRLICWFTKKHKRGQLIMVVNTAAVPTNTYRCPRCSATWSRKQRKR
jgi:hypothetical protein